MGHHNYKSTSWILYAAYSRNTITTNQHQWILYEAYSRDTITTNPHPWLLNRSRTTSLQIHIHGYSMGPTHLLTGRHHYRSTSMDTLWGLLTGHHHYKSTSMDTLWGLLTYSPDTITTNPIISKYDLRSGINGKLFEFFNAKAKF